MFGYAPLDQTDKTESKKDKAFTEKPHKDAEKASAEFISKNSFGGNTLTEILTKLSSWTTTLTMYFKAKLAIQQNSKLKLKSTTKNLESLKENSRILSLRIQNQLKSPFINFDFKKDVIEFLHSEIFEKCPKKYKSIRSNIETMIERLGTENRRLNPTTPQIDSKTP